MSRTHTYTYVVLEVSHAAYAEVAKALRAADYHHCFHDNEGRVVIDMEGIALAAAVQSTETVRQSRSGSQGGKD